MKALASYIMRGRLQAIAAVAGFTTLSLVIPLFMYVSIPAIALVALRHGFREALLPLGVAILILSLAAVAPFAVPLVFVVILAQIMRLSRSMALTLIASAGIMVAGIVAFHAAVGDTGKWWLSIVHEMDTGAMQQADVEKKEKFYKELELVAPQITGIFAAALLMHSLFCLFIARWWQAMLYNPGGFREEFHQLNLGKAFAGVVTAVAISAMLDLGVLSVIAKDALMIAAILYLLQGVSVVHVFFDVKHLPKGILYGTYGFIVLVTIMSPILVTVMPGLMQYVLILILIVIVQGYVETWVNLRRRLKAQNPGNPE